MGSENQSVNWTQSLNSTIELNDSSLLFGSGNELPNTVETFCNTRHPTSKQFDALQDPDKLQAFRDYLKVSIELKVYIYDLMFIIMFQQTIYFLENTRKRLFGASCFRYH